MPRFFSETNQFGQVVIMGRDVQHIRGSLRKVIGDELPVRVDDLGYMGRIVTMDSRSIVLDILFPQELSDRGSRAVHLGISLIDFKDMDDLIREVTELGVAEIHPFVARRSNLRDVGEKRSERWRQIIFEVIKQCERKTIPIVHDAMSIDEFLKSVAPSWPRKLVASLDSKNPIQASKSEDTGILIGPEGGFTREEMEMIHASGFTPVHMGRTILRSCTAAITAVGILAMQ